MPLSNCAQQVGGWRGNADGLGSWTFVTRISKTTLQATGMGFFGIYGSTAALATTLTLATVVSCIGFLRGTHTGRQRVTDNATVAPMLTDMALYFQLTASFCCIKRLIRAGTSCML